MKQCSFCGNLTDDVESVDETGQTLACRSCLDTMYNTKVGRVAKWISIGLIICLLIAVIFPDIIVRLFRIGYRIY